MNNNPPEKLNLSDVTVESLRKKCVKVRVEHFRHVTAIENGKVIDTIVPKREIYRLKKEKIAYVVSPNSGYTKVSINYNGREYVGRADCSATDGFCYKRGREIAMGRMELANKEGN